jgi:thioredoxin reductase (NADPH)
MSNNHYNTDIAIIGAGPAGLFAVFQAGMLRMRTIVVEALENIGGQCSALYPEKPIYDIPAYPQISGQDLTDKLLAQAAAFSPQYLCNETIEKITGASGNFSLISKKNTVINAKAILIAAGGGAFGPNRPPLSDIELFEGKSVFYHVSNKEIFRNKRVVIAGGGDSAADWAIELSSIAANVALIHRRAKFRCSPESQARVEELTKAGKIQLVVPYQLHSISGENGQIKTVTVQDLQNNSLELQADFLLPFFGLSMDLGPIANWGLGLSQKHINVSASTMETSQTGIFAIGDIATYPGKLKLILCGFSEAAMAAHSIYPLIHPDQHLNFEYSTSKGIPNS